MGSKKTYIAERWTLLDACPAPTDPTVETRRTNIWRVGRLFSRGAFDSFEEVACCGEFQLGELANPTFPTGGFQQYLRRGCLYGADDAPLLSIVGNAVFLIYAIKVTTVLE